MGSKLFRYGHQLNAHDLLKVLAIFTMIVDHIGVFFLWDLPMLRIIGRLAAPIFFFLIGYSNSTRLVPSFFLFGTILTALGMSLLDHTFLNILFTFLLCRLIFKYWQPETSDNRKLAMLFPLLALLALPTNWVLEYGTMGFAWAIAGRLVRSKVEQESMLALTWTVGCTVLTYFFSAYNLEIFSSERTDTLPLALGLLIICLILALLGKYKNRPLPCHKVFALPLMLLARYSLIIYVAHLLLFYSVLFLFGERVS